MQTMKPASPQHHSELVRPGVHQLSLSDLHLLLVQAPSDCLFPDDRLMIGVDPLRPRADNAALMFYGGSHRVFLTTGAKFSSSGVDADSGSADSRTPDFSAAGSNTADSSAADSSTVDSIVAGSSTAHASTVDSIVADSSTANANTDDLNTGASSNTACSFSKNVVFSCGSYTYSSSGAINYVVNIYGGGEGDGRGDEGVKGEGGGDRGDGGRGDGGGRSGDEGGGGRGDGGDGGGGDGEGGSGDGGVEEGDGRIVRGDEAGEGGGGGGGRGNGGEEDDRGVGRGNGGTTREGDGGEIGRGEGGVERGDGEAGGGGSGSSNTLSAHLYWHLRRLADVALDKRVFIHTFFSRRLTEEMRSMEEEFPSKPEGLPWSNMYVLEREYGHPHQRGGSE